jgi:hypothetical protein
MMKDEILRMCAKGHVSFVELEQIVGFSGDLAWGNDEYNIWSWFSMSEDACDALDNLLRDGYICLNPSEPLVYIIDGGIPRAPIAKSMRKYRNPHWLPVTVSLTKRGRDAE